MKTLISRFMKDESGATAIEYGMIAALIAVAIIGLLATIGDELATAFQSIIDELQA